MSRHIEPSRRAIAFRRLLVGIFALALLLPGVATAAAYAYADNWWWMVPGQGAGSNFSSAWRHNWFIKQFAGYDTTVTFIDSTGYNWHATVRNTWKTTPTMWDSTAVKKAHCRSNTVLEFGGSCVVATN